MFDEASAIPDAIWEVTDGALTDADSEIVWAVFGNPTRTTGRFRECFGRWRHRWITRQVDARTVEGTNKDLLAAYVEDYGEDSDFVRVRVTGQFPRAGRLQFVPEDLVRDGHGGRGGGAAQRPGGAGRRCRPVRRRPVRDRAAPGAGCANRTLGCRFRGVDTMTLAGRVGELIDRHRPDAVFIDEGGVGGGVVDRLRQLGHRVRGVSFGAAADRGTLNAVDAAGERYANKRAEMWGAMRAWLKGGAIPDDPALQADLTGVEYGYDAHDRIQLERKEMMKRRGLASPDLADALALTFAYPVAPRASWRDRAGKAGPMAVSDYNPFAADPETGSRGHQTSTAFRPNPCRSGGGFVFPETCHAECADPSWAAGAADRHQRPPEHQPGRGGFRPQGRGRPGVPGPDGCDAGS